MASDSGADWVGFFWTLALVFYLCKPLSPFCSNGLSTKFGRSNGWTIRMAWQVRLSEMLLGPPPAGFTFSPKHKSNAYDKAENG